MKKELKALSLEEMRKLSNKYLDEADKLFAQALKLQKDARTLRNEIDVRERAALAVRINEISDSTSGHCI